MRFLTGTRYRATVERTGAEFVALPPAADIDIDHVDDLYPERRSMKPIPQLRFSMETCFIAPVPAQLQAIEAAIADRPVDVILTEMMFLANVVLHQRPRAERPPIIALGIFPLVAADPDVAPFGLGMTPLPGPLGRLRNRVLGRVSQRLFSPLLERLEPVFREVNGTAPRDVSAFDLPGNADAVVQFTVPSFEYPRSTLPDTVVFAGPVRRPAPSDPELPEWWHELDGRTVVHVSQGTAANTDLTELIVPTLRALADKDVLVVVSTGGAPLEGLGGLPANARAAEYLPYELLFPKVSAFVTNGGYGGLHFALAHGVPIVAAGTSEDKLETTARVQWSGVGIRLRTQRPTERAIRRAVDDVLSDPRYRRAAGRVRDQIAASPGLAAIDDMIASQVRAFPSD
ncbi:MAG: glycosyltransferase [Microbacterium sp.]